MWIKSKRHRQRGENQGFAAHKTGKAQTDFEECPQFWRKNAEKADKH